MKPAFRSLVLQVHRWCGLTVGLVILLMAITGASIVFRPGLEPVLNRDLLTVPACTARVTLDTLAANAAANGAAVRPAATLDYIRLVAGRPGAPRMPSAMVRFTDQHFVYLNPCTGAVLGERSRYGGLLGTIEQIHRFRFMKHGSLITGTSAILFGLLLIGGGTMLWWPRSRHGWRIAFVPGSGARGQALAYRLHRTAGIYASAILLSMVLTGLPWAFDWYAHGIYAMTGSPQPARPPKSAVPANDAQRQPLERFWRIAQSLSPDPQDALLHIPGKPRDPVEMYLIDRDAPHPNARTMLFIDAYTGKVLRFVPYARSSIGHKLYFWALSWHTGAVGGVFGQLLLLAGALCVPLLAFTGIRNALRRARRPAARHARLTVRVASKTIEADGVCAFELTDPAGRKLPPFAAGAHIDVHLGDGLVRQYSLCGDPRERRRYLIAVLRVTHSRGGSAAMHERIHEGDLLEIGAPVNHFALDETAPRSLLLAGGIGITPIIGMAERLAWHDADFELHYCARSRSRAAFVQRLACAPFAGRARFHFSDTRAEQRFDIERVLDSQSQATHLYVCGPAGFIDAVLRAARNRGWPERQLHCERFAPAAQVHAAARAFDVQLASTGKVYRIPVDKSVAASLAEHGVRIPTSCEQGVCGTCVTRVLAGDVEHLDCVLTPAQRERHGHFTPCCSRAKGDLLVLDI
ncbi:flavodoxin reductase [Burkholderia sp. Bp8963]|uniref:PepSY domain-containing protein n=1 Tax=Burkholderia sp. Bp8963 TaxID=2184547 RepID=UPI000F5B7715|nr:PepSY domain-containing protein [Burkholderia sp. Bp8963]RQS68224.1 flavodoxin reductase [Burkholderia sp. Bp8963]